MSTVLEQLAVTLAERRQGDPDTSYVASLHHKGLNKILEKVGEEATEVILAAYDRWGPACPVDGLDNGDAHRLAFWHSQPERANQASGPGPRRPPPTASRARFARR